MKRNSSNLPRLLTIAVLGNLLAAASPANAAPEGATELLSRPLTCTLKTVQAGQFHDLDFASGPLGGSSTLMIAASPDDLRLGRAALIEDDHASVADIVLSDTHVVLVATEPSDGGSMLSLFTSASRGPEVTAAFSRHILIGSIPVLVQSAGTCRPA